MSSMVVSRTGNKLSRNLIVHKADTAGLIIYFLIVTIVFEMLRE